MDGGPEEHRALGVFDTDGPALEGKGNGGVITFDAPNLHLTSYKSCAGVSTTRLKLALVGAGSALS